MNTNTTDYVVNFYLNFRGDEDTIITDVESIVWAITADVEHWLGVRANSLVPCVSYKHARFSICLPVPHSKTDELEKKVNELGQRYKNDNKIKDYVLRKA